MKIRCIANTGEIIPENYLNPAVFLTKETKFQLIVGKEYTVYALYKWQQEVWYYICDERYTYYPIQNPAPLFEIVDGRLSKYWRLQIDCNGLLTLAFEQWFFDSYYYDKLTNQEEHEVLIFEQIKELMDKEALSPYPSPSVLDESLKTSKF
ncbi:hypothetical protein [Iningainema tapete]|uniref:Uncharacterized protein n=1 Tax=Iningainema tapete BLCC-T55 TaxID=2748662 RepID=A0A8J6XE49_9CYAN|nr:hypothetical protein [Iningainema tapete]MBD2770832.1 hypothetical protein [Iningainema tapete BLCC-T55]